jgi:hypothetical protein
MTCLDHNVQVSGSDLRPRINRLVQDRANFINCIITMLDEPTYPQADLTDALHQVGSRLHKYD